MNGRADSSFPAQGEGLSLGGISESIGIKTLPKFRNSSSRMRSLIAKKVEVVPAALYVAPAYFLNWTATCIGRFDELLDVLGSSSIEAVSLEVGRPAAHTSGAQMEFHYGARRTKVFQ